MKILFSPCHYIYDEVSGGSEPMWAFNIADALARHYPGSLVVTGYTNVQGEKPYRIVTLQPHKNKVDLSIKNALQFNLLYFRETLRQLRQSEFDVVHHVLPFAIGSTFNLTAVLRLLKKKPFLIGPVQSPLTYVDTDLDSSDIRGFKQEKERSQHVTHGYISRVTTTILRELSRQTMKQARYIIAITHEAKRLLLVNGVPSEKIVVIPPGVDVEKYMYTPFTQKRTDVFELLSVGYLLHRKGVDVLLQGVQQLAQKYPQLRLKIVGDGPQRDKLQETVVSYGISNIVTFEGYIPHKDIAPYYAKSHLFVSMTRDESWGQMYVEAMACGLPIVTTGNIGSKEILTHSLASSLVPIDDVSAFIQKVSYLIDHPNELQELGRIGREKVEASYDWSKAIIPQYLSLYESI